MGRGRWCLYKRTTFIICSINVVVALYVFHSLFESFYMYSRADSNKVAKYSQDQINKIEESFRIQKAAEPKMLIKLMTKMKDEIHRGENVAKLPLQLKEKLTDEILHRLKNSGRNVTATMQKDIIEKWRREKLEEVKLFAQNSTTTISGEYASLIRDLKFNWRVLFEEIGLWFPEEVFNKAPDGKPENENEFGDVIAGRSLPETCGAEVHADYSGTAIRWGLTHHKDSAYDCCMACFSQAKNAKPGNLRCNIWVYCPSEAGCHSPDVYTHKYHNCWLKYAEKPSHTFKGRYSETYRRTHPSAPMMVPWVAGVIKASG